MKGRFKRCHEGRWTVLLKTTPSHAPTDRAGGKGQGAIVTAPSHAHSGQLDYGAYLGLISPVYR